MRYATARKSRAPFGALDEILEFSLDYSGICYHPDLKLGDMEFESESELRNHVT